MLDLYDDVTAAVQRDTWATEQAEGLAADEAVSLVYVANNYFVDVNSQQAVGTRRDRQCCTAS